MRHANGTRLEIFGEATANGWEIRYLNDGYAPSQPIVEGSGLSALRAQVEAAGGAMAVEHAPRFRLTLILPQESGRQNEIQSHDRRGSDHARELFELRIQSSEHFETALSIDNASLAEVYCLRFPVDLILMDVVTRNGENGLDAAAKIKRAFPKIKIIIVTSMPEYSYLSRAREIGVESFWYKEEQRESLLDVMERTMAGESVYPDATPELQLGLASSYEFTERELEVLREMTGGDTNQEIAERLHISVATVKSHILNMLEKTGFRNRTELAVRARESGLVILNRKN